jgi:hypothetical protein
MIMKVLDAVLMFIGIAALSTLITVPALFIIWSTVRLIEDMRTPEDPNSKDTVIVRDKK